jgi:predicted small lipoprotein YifL
MKNVIKLMVALLAVTMSMNLASCGHDEPEIVKPDTPNNPNNPDNPDNPNNPNPNDPNTDKLLTPTEQKEFLEKVALEFMNLIPSQDFQELGELGKFITDIYINNYDWENVGDWGKDILDAVREPLGTSSFDSKTENWGRYNYTYNYIYTNFKSLLMASNFTGHFVALHGYWSYERASDLQFIFNDKQGQRLVLKVETSGETARVHAFDINDWTGGYTDDFGYTVISNDYYDRTAYTIAVPERIVVTLLRGQSQLVKTTVKINLKSVSDEEFDLSKGSVDASVTTEFNNGYKFDFSQVHFSGNSTASIKFAMSKGSKALITMAVSADLINIPSVNVSAFSSETFDIDDYNIDDVNAKDAFVKLDILGKVQMQGKLKDVRKYVDYLEKADENDGNESQYRSYINQANSLTDVNLYYNNTTTKQATIKLEPFKEEGWYNNYWTVEPIIIFGDNSSYSTFEAFFNDTDFRRTIDAFKSLANAYADIIDEQIYW